MAPSASASASPSPPPSPDHQSRPRRLDSRFGATLPPASAAAAGGAAASGGGGAATMLRPVGTSGGAAGVGGGDDAGPGQEGSRNVNALPLLTVDCAQIAPPWARTSSWTIERPRPKPPYLRLIEPSACAVEGGRGLVMCW